MTMRIALLTYSTRPRGGVVHTLALAEALARRNGTDVTVISLARGGDAGFFRPVDPRVTVELAPFEDRPDEPVGARIVRSIEVLRRHLHPERFDVVHAQDCITANAADGACIRTVHHIDEFHTPELARCHERAIVLPHTHVCVSRAVASELAVGWGVDATVIPNGVDADRFAIAASDTEDARRDRDAWRDHIGSPWVLAVGGIEPRKGTLDLVDAFHRLRHSHGTLRLVIAGGETLFDYRPYRAEVEARCAELDVEPLVLGPVDHDRLPSLVAASTAFAFPSTKEGFGLAAMEALAAGVPVVCRDLPVLRDVFGGAVRFAGTPDEFAAALDAAIHRPDQARSAAGHRLAQAHDWDAAAGSHHQLYERTVATGATCG